MKQKVAGEWVDLPPGRLKVKIDGRWVSCSKPPMNRASGGTVVTEQDKTIIRNLCVNPSFEVDNSGWTGVGASVIRNTQGHGASIGGIHPGSSCGQMGPVVASAQLAADFLYTKPGYPYYIWGQFGSSGPNKWQAFIDFYDLTNAVIPGGDDPFALIGQSNGTFFQREAHAVAPDGTYAAYIGFRADAAASGGYLFFDTVMIAEGPLGAAPGWEVPYIEGGQLGAVWEGEAGKSVSKKEILESTWSSTHTFTESGTFTVESSGRPFRVELIPGGYKTARAVSVDLAPGAYPVTVDPETGTVTAFEETAEGNAVGGKVVVRYEVPPS